MLIVASTVRDKGFTLVELLIGVAIVAIVIAAGLPGFSTWMHNARIRTVAESMTTGLQIARTEAVQRNATVNFRLVDGTGWTVGCATDACPAVIQRRAAGEGSSSAITVSTAADMPVTFNNLGQMIAPALAAGTTFAAIDVDVNPSVLPAAQSKNLRITVSLSGGIRLCDPNAAEGDTRAC